MPGAFPDEVWRAEKRPVTSDTGATYYRSERAQHKPQRQESPQSRPFLTNESFNRRYRRSDEKSSNDQNDVYDTPAGITTPSRAVPHSRVWSRWKPWESREE